MNIDDANVGRKMRGQGIALKLVCRQGKACFLADVFNQRPYQGLAACLRLPTGAKAFHVVGQRKQVSTMPLGQALHQGHDLIFTHTGYEPVKPLRVEPPEIGLRHRNNQPVIGGTRIEVIIERALQIVLVVLTRKLVSGDACRLVAHQVFFA